MTTTLLFDMQVRLAVYHGFLAKGVAPTPAEIATSLNTNEADVRTELMRLHEAHLLVIQPDTQQIIMAHPFSATPTPFRVEHGKRLWWANCIWDSLGIAQMLDINVSISTSCPCCGEALNLQVQDKQVTGDESIIHFAIPAKRWWDDIAFT